MCLDDYHGLDRRERKLIGVTALDPQANNFALMENQLLALKRGNPIMKPVYDHSDGTFGPPEEVEPKEVVIVHVLHPFLVPGVRGLVDLNVWLDRKANSSTSGRCSGTWPSAAGARPSRSLLPVARK